MIKVLYNSETIGTFTELTATFRCGYSLEDLFEGEPQLAFVLEKGVLNAEAIWLLMTNQELKSGRFTIQFTLEGKDYSINKATFDSMTAVENVGGGILLLGRQAPFSRIEGVGKLANFKDFPIEFIKHGFTIND